MKSIAVYCGSSKGTNPIYQEVAEELGKALASQNITLIYGAGSVGLMGILANKVLENGGKATGVIPQFLVDMEVAHKNLTELIVVPTMHERKQIMADRADGVIVLPGGFGTLDELFEMLTWGQLGLHKKPIGLLNINGYFDYLFKQMEVMVSQGFLKERNKELVIVADKVSILLEKVKSIKPSFEPKWIEKT